MSESPGTCENCGANVDMLQLRECLFQEDRFLCRDCHPDWNTTLVSS